MAILLMLLLAYLFGSIPFGYLIARIWNIDIRKYGSGNIGATNVIRVLGPLPGSLVLLLDLLKGTAAVYLTSIATSHPDIIIVGGLLAVLGHMFSIFLKLKGGKGAATGLGVLLGIAPEIFLGAVICAIIIIFLTRYVSIASMVTAILITTAFIVLHKPLPYTLVVALVSTLLIIRHIPNIKRLLNGTENKFGGIR